MRYTVVAVGRMRDPFAGAMAHYMKMLGGHARVDVVEVKDASQVERRIPERAYRVQLDSRGRRPGGRRVATCAS